VVWMRAYVEKWPEAAGAKKRAARSGCAAGSELTSRATLRHVRTVCHNQSLTFASNLFIELRQ
ncbi:MAG TPA: hypothetical protein VIH72_06955, partial [Candidatus Acidoferrales bacterium]